MSDARPLRVVQVGLGDWGRDWAWRVIRDVKDVDLVGYVDTDPAALKLVAKKVKASAEHCFELLPAAIEATRPDAALVTATLPAHVPIVRSALEAGLHVLVEKPFAPTLALAVDLVNLAAAQQRILMVSQNYRFFPAPRAVATLLRESPLGPLHEISIDFRRWSRSSGQGPLRQHREEQPLLVDMSIHHFDLLRFLLGQEPQRVYCEAWNPGWSEFSGPSAAMAAIVFDGVVVGYRGSWLSTGPITSWAGEWRMEFEGGQVFWTSRDDNGALADRIVVTPRSGKPKTMTLQRMPRVDRWGTLKEFADAVQANREPACSGRDNLGTIAFVAAAVASATQHEPVVPEGIEASLVM